MSRETVPYVSNVYKYYLACNITAEQQAKARAARQGAVNKRAGKIS